MTEKTSTTSGSSVPQAKTELNHNNINNNTYNPSNDNDEGSFSYFTTTTTNNNTNNAAGAAAPTSLNLMSGMGIESAGSASSSGRETPVVVAAVAAATSATSPVSPRNMSPQPSASSKKSSPSLSNGGNNNTTQLQHWRPSGEWVASWKSKLPLQTIMRLLQVLVPQVEKICIDKGLTDESEILKFLQNGTLVGLLPVPHPILIRKYQPNYGTIMWFRTYMWGVIYLR